MRQVLSRALSIVVVAGLFGVLIRLSVEPREEVAYQQATNSDIHALRGALPYSLRGISIDQLMTLP